MPLEAGGAPRALLVDIEGTTTPIDFVTKVLFPFARLRLPQFVEAALFEGSLEEEIAALGRERAEDLRRGLDPPAWTDRSADSIGAYLLWLMDRDRKSTPLKTIQGRIWEAGYRAGELRGEVYPDVPPAFERWRSQGRDVAIFSSGSVLAQRLLFSCSTAGDLTPYIRDYFDTTVGPKREAASYLRIADRLGWDAASVLFVSDTPAELDAARAAGTEIALCVRQGSERAAGWKGSVIESFDEIF
jgi:enolase-phosphatase E1